MARAYRWLKRAGLGLAGLLAIVLVAAALFALSAGTRTAILRAALPRVDRALPGRLTIGSPAWPGAQPCSRNIQVTARYIAPVSR